MARRACKGTNKAGQPCKAAPLTGSETCIAHSGKELQLSTGFGGAQVGAGRPKTPRVSDVMRERYEDEIDAWYQVLLDARTASKPVGVGEGDDFRIIHTPDHTTRLAAFREVNDRVYGKARQAVEHTGPDGDTIQVALPVDFERALRVVEILSGVGAIPVDATVVEETNGHGNGHRTNGH